MARKSPVRRGLSLFEFSDEEFLHIVRDQGDKEGWVTTQTLSDAIGLDVEHPNRYVGIRLGWMRRYGVVERDMQPGSRTLGAWRLTNTGERIVSAKFSAAQARTIKELQPEKLWELSKLVTSRYVTADPATANLVRRSFTLGTRRRRGY